MLILTRKPGEIIDITTEDGVVITVTLVGMSHGRIQLGFDAPLDVKIYRREINPMSTPEREEDR